MRAIRDTMVLSPPLVITEAKWRSFWQSEALHRPHGADLRDGSRRLSRLSAMRFHAKVERQKPGQFMQNARHVSVIEKLYEDQYVDR
jgi:hypothetical protein